MNRQQLEHVIRAACHIADVDDLVILGSQATLGQFPDAPRKLLVSMEVNLYPRGWHRDSPMDPDPRDELLAMAQADHAVRSRLLGEGVLEEGYHPHMESLHRRHAARLDEILEALGRWPGSSVVGEDGAEAAWLIVQHAIGEPTFQRHCLALLLEAIDAGEAPAWQAAYLEDRIRVFEGRPQRFGTQFDVARDGSPVPYPIEDPASVDERRLAVGLEPMEERLAKLERGEPMSEERWLAKQREAEAWLRRVGWRR